MDASTDEATSDVGTSEETSNESSAAPIDQAIAALVSGDCQRSLESDFAERDLLPQTDTPPSEWPQDDTSGGQLVWGPQARPMPAVGVPVGCSSSSWQRARVLSAAKRYLGLPYRHHHIPAWQPVEGPGLDCSNFIAWVYDYGLGIMFTGNVGDQADGPRAPGRRLAPGEALFPGDLLYIRSADGGRVVHATIYVDAEHVVDSTGPGARLRQLTGWYVTRFSHARRVIE
jgi:cell wall-associated NlpC family hydrolase